MSDLIPSRGAIAEPLTFSVVRELISTDMLRLSEAPKVGVPILQRLRAQHHRQAQLQAAGHAMNEIAAIVGCTTARLTQLQGDPMYMDLVSYYKDQIMTAMIEDSARLRDKLVDAGEMAVDELRDRLEDNERRNRMSTSDVRQIAEFAMDRTVAPPKAAPAQSPIPPNITINFGTPIRQGRTLDATENLDLLTED